MIYGSQAKMLRYNNSVQEWAIHKKKISYAMHIQIIWSPTNQKFISKANKYKLGKKTQLMDKWDTYLVQLIVIFMVQLYLLKHCPIYIIIGSFYMCFYFITFVVYHFMLCSWIWKATSGPQPQHHLPGFHQVGLPHS